MTRVFLFTLKILNQYKLYKMKNILDNMRERAIAILADKIEWRKASIIKAEEEIIAKLIGQPNNEYSIESAFKGLCMLKSTLAEMEALMKQLQPAHKPARKRK